MGNKNSSEAENRRNTSANVRDNSGANKDKSKAKSSAKAEKKLDTKMRKILQNRGFDLNDLRKTSFIKFSDTTPMSYAVSWKYPILGLQTTCSSNI